MKELTREEKELVFNAYIDSSIRKELENQNSDLLIYTLDHTFMNDLINEIKDNDTLFDKKWY